MAIRSGFFNSVNGDRKYDAKRFAEYFNSFIGNGVFPNPSDNLQVMANGDMTVTIKPGKAWINGYILINDEDYILQIEPADGVLNRVDRIVLRYDTVDREIRLEVKQGNYASNAVAKELQRDGDAYELALADIAINKGIVSISQSSITDLRLNKELCGIVHGTVDQVDVTTLYNQYTQGFELKKEEFEQEFMAWFATLQDVLDENAAANLLNMINDHKDDRDNPHNLTVEQIGAETPEGAQAKANAAASSALAAANSHTDQEVGALAGEGNVKTVKQLDDDLAAHKAESATNAHLPRNVGLGNVTNDKQMPIAGGQFAGIAKAHNNTSYTIAQIRNIVLSPNEPSGGDNGDIWIKYS